MQETKNPEAGGVSPAPSVTSSTPDPAGLSSVTGAFRRPVLRQRGPQLRTLAGLAGWAATLGVVGLVIGIRGLLVILVGKPPHWYEPTLIILGLVGIALAAGAFLTVQYKRVPWVLLGLSSAVLLASIIVSNAA
jgi:hypothetical protein